MLAIKCELPHAIHGLKRSRCDSFCGTFINISPVLFHKLTMEMVSVLLIFLGLISLPVLIFLVILIYLCHKHAKYDHLPGPKREGFFRGNMSMVHEQRNRRGITIHQIWTELAAYYSPMFVFWFYHRPVVVITDAELVKDVLVTMNLPRDQFGYSHLSSLFGERMLGGSLLSEVSEEIWHIKRTTLEPGFHRPNLMTMMDNFNSICDSFLQRLECMADDKTLVSMAEELVRINLDAIAKVAFDLDLNAINDPKAAIPSNVRTALEGLIQSFRKPFMRFQPGTFGYQAKCREAVRFLRRVAQSVIEKRMDENKNGGGQHRDILSYILLLLDKVSTTTMDDLVDNFLSFIVGGEETSSNHMTYLVAAVISHPEVEKRLVQEVDEVLGSRSTISYEDFGKLRYFDQVVKEALRLHPPQPVITRMTPENIVLGNYPIPSKTSIMVNAYLMHHHVRYWDEPEKFDPDRFEPSNHEKMEHYAYIPFSLGRHTCIGMHFAHFETKVLLVRLFQTFKLKLVPGQELKPLEHMSLRPKNGVVCTLSIR